MEGTSCGHRIEAAVETGTGKLSGIGANAEAGRGTFEMPRDGEGEDCAVAA